MPTPRTLALASALAGAGAALIALARHLAKRRAAAAAPRAALDPTEEAAVGAAVAYAACNGLLMRGAPAGSANWVHCPFALQPMPFPRAEFERAVRLAPLFGRLVHRVASDAQWLHDALDATALGDPFTQRLLAISRAVHAEGDTQPIRLGLFRSDYMLHGPGLQARALGVGGGNGGTTRPHSLLQVELNTIAASFGCLSALVSRMHAALAPPPIADAALAATPASPPPPLARGGSSRGGSSLRPVVEQPLRPPAAALPRNPALSALPDALAAAVRLYIESAAASAASTGGGAACTAVRPIVVLFVVQPSERNSADQLLLAAALEERTSRAVRTVRRTLQQLAECAHLGPSACGTGGAARERALVLRGVPELCCAGAEAPAEAEVAVAYLRAGYSPDDYPSPDCWDARLLIERSLAVKCPSINYHLAGAKKVQQALAMPGAVEQFLAPDEAAEVRASFAGLWALDELDAPMRLPVGAQVAADTPACAPTEAAPADAHSAQHGDGQHGGGQHGGGQHGGGQHGGGQHGGGVETLRQRLLRQPADFVLKPQREGGGNNFYGDAIPPKLASLAPGDEAAYILMERIRPPVHHGRLLVRGEVARRMSTLSELGILSAFLCGTEGEEVRNEYAGHLLRTKAEAADEGGVAAGFAVLDSPLLV